jgi:zinc protease
MTRRALLAMAVTPAFAADHLNRAPVSHENLTVKFPEAVPVKLSNGVTLLAIEDNRLPIALVRFQVEDAGTIFSPHPGLAECTAEMLTEGGGGRSGKQIADEAARLGTTLTSSAPAAAEAALADGSGLTSRFSEWLELLTGVVMHPSFPADEFNVLRQRWLVRRRLFGTQPSNLADEALLRLTYGSHPAAITIPSAESLGTLTPEMLAAWHRERYTPAKMVVLCIGRVRTSAFASNMEKILGGWKAAEANPSPPPPPQPASARRIVLIDRPGAAQTELAIGGLLMERRDPDFISMVVLNGVLGGTVSSRLFRILRDEKGYAYNAGSTYGAFRFPGFWRVKAGVRTDATADSLAIILGQLRRLCDEPVPAAELDRSKSNAVGSFALRLEQPSQVINQSYLRYRYGFSADYWERYAAKVNAVTAAETQAVAQKYLTADRAHIVAVGDAARIRPALEKLGKVEA